MRRHPSVLAVVAVVVVVAASLLSPFVAQVPAAHADGPGTGAPWVVSLGDSYISGEAGRWAGNSNASPSRVDALGAGAYLDNATATAESIAGCHRSGSAEIHIGGGINSLNLACSGARTTTFTDASGSFKPGVDFANVRGQFGQAQMLQDFAAVHNVTMIQLSIGGNNFNFADIVQTCVLDFLFSPSWWKNYCHDDASVKANFTSANIAAQTAAIQAAIANVQTAMANAGYAAGQYSVVVQTYPSPIPPGASFRYSQSGYTRQSVGGCGFWNKDADWANNTAMVHINNAVKNAAAASGATVKVLDLAGALNGRRLCETGVNLVENTAAGTWTGPGAADTSEWVAQIRTVSTILGPYYLQESIHPNYWGQLALRNCVRQVFNNGVPRSGTCTRGAGLNAVGEPNMTLS